jgi:hypothetical protein
MTSQPSKLVRSFTPFTADELAVLEHVVEQCDRMRGSRLMKVTQPEVTVQAQPTGATEFIGRIPQLADADDIYLADANTETVLNVSEEDIGAFLMPFRQLYLVKEDTGGAAGAKKRRSHSSRRRRRARHLVLELVELGDGGFQRRREALATPARRGAHSDGMVGLEARVESGRLAQRKVGKLRNVLSRHANDKGTPEGEQAVQDLKTWKADYQGALRESPMGTMFAAEPGATESVEYTPKDILEDWLNGVFFHWDRDAAGRVEGPDRAMHAFFLIAGVQHVARYMLELGELARAIVNEPALRAC